MKNKIFTKRLPSLLVIILIYILAALVGYLVASLFSGLEFVLRLLFADIAATIFVWLTGVLLRNSSVYDPYWSVAPPIMLLAALINYQNINATIILAAVVISVWSIRLTSNWIYTFENLYWQDWRYVQYRTRHPRLWFFINLFGINLMPTLFVFAGMLPVFALVKYAKVLNLGVLAGLFISLTAVGIELVADVQMHKFRKTNTNNATNTLGLWALSRHPNYFGEITFWLGLFLTMFFALNSYFYLFLCPLLMIMLFVFISIPLMEKRQLSRRSDYQEYKNTTSMLIPLPKKKPKGIDHATK